MSVKAGHTVAIGRTVISRIRVTADDPTVLEANLESALGTLIDRTPYNKHMEQYVEIALEDYCLSIVMEHDGEGITIEIVSTQDTQAQP